MATAENLSPTPPTTPPSIQRPFLLLAGLLTLAVLATAADIRWQLAVLFAIGLGLGVSLYHASFGFTAAYRRVLLERDISGIAAQFLMLTVAMVLFAPMLSASEVFGHRAGGFVSPVSVSMFAGAFLFGIGMQLGGGCASGTLFTSGGGNVRMAVVLVFFCAGCFWATLDMDWWRGLPRFGAVSFGRELGYGTAVAAQVGVLAAIYVGLRALGLRHTRPLWPANGVTVRDLLRGPWPLLLGALMLAVLNAATIAVAGHPWGVTWGFTVWAAKVATALGWDPATSTYWDGRIGAIEQSIFASTTSLMNIGVVLGAMAAASLAGKVRPTWRIPPRQLAAAVIGGLMMGYGARLAYGCNIGAFFSGIASTSLHGWVWIVAAMAGNVIGVRLRPLFGFRD